MALAIVDRGDGEVHHLAFPIMKNVSTVNALCCGRMQCWTCMLTATFIFRRGGVFTDLLCSATLMVISVDPPGTNNYRN